MNKDQKVGNLMELIISKGGRVWGDEVPIRYRGKTIGWGRIMKILATGGALMKVIVEITKWSGN